MLPRFGLHAVKGDAVADIPPKRDQELAGKRYDMGFLAPAAIGGDAGLEPVQPDAPCRAAVRCKERDQRLLLSGDLMDLLTVPESVSVTSLGSERLRGKAHPVELFTAARVGAAAGSLIS